MEEGTISADPVEASPVTTPLSDHVRRDWVDRLVDLSVLAAHGDVAAADRAHAWIAHDPEAHEVWDRIAEACDRVRAEGA